MKQEEQVADHAVDRAFEIPVDPAPGSPHPRDAGVVTPREAASDDEAPPADEDMGFIGSVQHDDEIMSLMMNLGTASRNYKREGCSARRRMVSEIYSPPRVTRAISSMPSLRLVPGFALDLTCIDPTDGMPWDFDLESKRAKALELVRAEKPAMLIGSPMCTAWCTWQALNATRRDPAVVALELKKAKMHLKFVISLYREQMDGGRMFLHEHPESSASWQEEMVKDLLAMDAVDRVVGDQCRYGAEVMAGMYQGRPIRKSTGFMSNAPEVLKALRRRCDGKSGRCSRRRGGDHAICSGKIASDAQRYLLDCAKPYSGAYTKSCWRVVS